MYLTENKYAQILNCVVSITKNYTSAKIVSWRANDKNSLAINCMVGKCFSETCLDIENLSSPWDIKTKPAERKNSINIIKTSY